MRVLLVTHYYPEHRGGVEIVAGELAERLARRGVEIVWAATGPRGFPVVAGIRATPKKAWNITERFLGFPYPIWGPIGLFHLATEVRRSDLVHLHDCLYLGNLVAYVVARLAGKPVVVTQHIGMVPYSRRVLRILLSLANGIVAPLVLGNCARSIFISHKVQEFFRRFVRFRHEPLFMPNGVATEHFRPVAPEERWRLRGELRLPVDRSVILFVGRFVEKKGLGLIRGLAEQFPDMEWVFVGWGAEDPVGWGLPNVSCPGSLGREELTQYYQVADLLILPSVGEGFPLVVQEAMACGTPALISSETAQGIPGIESVAFVSEIQPEELAKAFSEILRSPESLRDRRNLVAEYAHRNWDWESCADRYRDLFAELVGGSSHTRPRQDSSVRRDFGPPWLSGQIDDPGQEGAEDGLKAEAEQRPRENPLSR